MDCIKVGKLIFSLRTEKGMTQKQLAAAMNISDKTISKWERGLGCPDVSLLGDLSEIFGVHIEKILQGNLSRNDADAGNMKKIKFFVCPVCGNVLTATGDAEIYCCGRRLMPLMARAAEEGHRLNVQEIEDEYYVTFDHEMSKQHFISFVACVACDKVLLIKLYPEQSGEFRMPRMRDGKLYFYCNQHGFWENK